MNQSLAQGAVEQRDGSLPGELGRSFVVTWRGVVVKTVLGSRVFENLELDPCCLERRFVRRPCTVDSVILLRKVNEQVRFDLRCGIR